ncbi:MAG: hypothetical protein KA184_05500 [Candidatus Hydrogenedentes bacterium]|nr:hypothetical protein [Candidatus Hydrogenedentota bacterium]
MRLLWLGNNALFLKNLRERTRPGMIAAAAIVTALVVVLVLVSVSTATGRGGVPWERQAFFVLACCQGLVLALLGSVSVSAMTARERTQGTLDFHRTSPTSPFNMVVGLILGAPILEWCSVLAVLPLAVSFGLRGGVALPLMGTLYGFMLLTVLLLHALCAAMTLTVERKSLHRVQSAIPVLLLLASFWVTAGGVGMRLGPLLHATCMPVVWTCFAAITEHRQDVFETAPFFGVMLPLWTMQIMVQGPLLLFAGLAAVRKIARPERPPFSKVQALAAAAFLLFLYVGAAKPAYGLPAAERLYPVIPPLLSSLYYVFGLGLAGILIVSPRYLAHLQALRRMQREGRHHLLPFEEGASNLAWLVVYAGLAAIAFCVLLWFEPPGGLIPAALAFLLAMSYLAWFAGGLELFYLSEQRKKRALMFVCVAAPWVLLPILGGVLDVNLQQDIVRTVLMSFSPFFGIGLSWTVLGADLSGVSNSSLFHFAVLPLVLNAALAVLLHTFAWAARMRLHREHQ